MSWIDLRTSYLPRSGKIVNWSEGEPEIFKVSAEITNNFPWELTHSEFYLQRIEGCARLVGADPLPQILKGDNIPPNGGKRLKEFVLESTGPGPVDVTLEYKWYLAHTDLTYSITGTVSLIVVED